MRVRVFKVVSYMFVYACMLCHLLIIWSDRLLNIVWFFVLFSITWLILGEKTGTQIMDLNAVTCESKVSHEESLGADWGIHDYSSAKIILSCVFLMEDIV